MQIPLQRYCGSEADLIVSGVPEGVDAWVLTRAAKKLGQRILFIARDDGRSAAIFKSCQFFAPDIPLLQLPAWDCLPYDRVSPGRMLAARRAAALFQIANEPSDGPSIVISTVNAVSQFVPPSSVIKETGFIARAGQVLKREALEEYLALNGYSRASTVVEPGDYAIRGGLVDVYSPALTDPIRLDFFGDELESLRVFDVETQRTVRQVDNVTFAPVSEIMFSEAARSIFRKNYIAAFGGGISKDPIYASVSEGIRPQGIEHYLPLFFEQLSTVFEYFDDETLIITDELLADAKKEREEIIDDFYQSREEHAQARDTGSGDPSKITGLYRPLEPSRLYLSDDEWHSQLRNHRLRGHSPFVPPNSEHHLSFNGTVGRSFSNERRTEGVNVFKAVIEHIKTLQSEKKRVLIACWSEGSADRMGNVFEDHDHPIPLLEDGPSALALKPGDVRRVILPQERGFELSDLAIISEQDILGDRLVNRGRKRKAKNFIAEASSLSPGDLIIHMDHGLGRYLGLKTLSVQDAPHDCLELEYAGGAKLYLPVENIELLSRYGAGSDNPVLDKLGGVAWQSRKAKAKKRLKDMAAELIKIAAKRLMRQSEPINVSPAEYNEFSARFPYIETDDQLNAIDDVLGDLEKSTPMDRLICGDVGFGKTEVALRAAYAVAMTGKQVALVAPTTLLCRQHFKTFSERFRGLPVNIRQLSRLVTPKEAKATKEELANGRCEIVIGTHALLAKNVQFADLELLIVDEEQRFGVQHKERLKSLRANVHVLTLTATPIPRTLQMALSGIRDLSLIATPPVDRLAVRTFVTPFDEISIRKAILREKYRGGQTFFVAPRISDLGRLEDFLRNDVPEVKYVIAHGQMNSTALEDIMTAFYDGQYDVLLTTSIIESGIDIPSANTMIVYRADRFGLAQLYQIRGRVGRSKVRAYAYLIMPDANIATANAVQRIKILQSLDTLGAGFTLASHDLDMRGGGNPLGEEQSGYIKDVGVELYQHMLEEAVAELKDGVDTSAQSWSPQVNLGVSVLIPENYIKDLNLRLATYRRIGEIDSDEASDAVSAELIDRFGALPEELKSLFNVMKIKRLSRQAHVQKVDAGPKGIVLTMRHQDITDPSVIMNAITQNNGWRLRPDQTIFVAGHLEQSDRRVKHTVDVLRALQGH